MASQKYIVNVNYLALRKSQTKQKHLPLHKTGLTLMHGPWTLSCRQRFFLRLSSRPQFARLVAASVCYIFICRQLAATFSNLEPTVDCVTCFRFGVQLPSMCGYHSNRPRFADRRLSKEAKQQQVKLFTLFK